MELVREDFYELDQLMSCQLGEDWTHDYDNEYEAAEAWIILCNDDDCTALIRDIDLLFALTDNRRSRLQVFSSGELPDEISDLYDAFLRAIRVRAVQALAGIHSEPMVEPPMP